MRLSHIKQPQFGHFGELRTTRAGSNTLDAGIGAPLGMYRLQRADSVSSRRLLKLSKKCAGSFGKSGRHKYKGYRVCR